ncbi:AAA family ATPase [Curtobacterium sp. MCBD17_013]|uniref:AAA family ATPase n=1 Tax=Curtobacterium sp. MCBD17_013 TaxID=2175668 RepID=UPI0011B5207D|nr:AAA family ATPase [Curtobacterium sp. MCBD17_013]
MSHRDREAARLRYALELLARSEVPLRRGDVWEAVAAEVPLTEEDLVHVASRPEPRAMNGFWFATSDLVRAGYMTKSGDGFWAITEAGLAALEEDDDPVAFERSAVARAREATRVLREDQAALRRSVVLPPHPRAEKVRQVAGRFRERGLRTMSSVFAEGRSVWRQDVAEELMRRFVEQEEVDGSSFADKLRTQFAEATDDARLLMAELIAWQVLPLQNPGERKKRERVSVLLEQMNERVLVPAEVDDAFRSWSFNPGQGMAHGIHSALSIVVRLVRQWVDLSDAERDDLLNDPWRWRDFVLQVPGSPFPTQRNELMYLVHPEAFGEVVSSADRDQIRVAFRGEVAGDADDPEHEDPDRLFQLITLALQVKNNGAIDFYQGPLNSIWSRSDDVPDLEPSREGAAAEDDMDGVRPDRVAFPSATSALANTLYIPVPWLQETLDLLERRKQVIFYGPPGTGKTFLAQALAAHVTSGSDGDATIVQFHPTYSYEDFFEGFRPVASDEAGNLKFTLRKGPLRRLADAAADNPESNFFLVIDEINRGNIAKVFGELYFLLEYRDSEISLLYSDEPFTLPSNIFVIGTMNTADRSIAMLDAAMRRRFAFVELHPDRIPVKDVLPSWVAAQGLQDDRADLLDRLNGAIIEHDAKVGPSFLMRDLDDAGVAAVWRYEILPLLAEYHYGEGIDLDARYGLAALRKQASAPISDLHTDAADDID